MIEDIRREARTYFDDRVGPAHDWHHVERVRSLATRLAAEREDVDERVLDLAVSLHDVGRPAEEAGEIADHATWGAAEARRILDEHGASEGTIEAVSHCVLAHRYSNDVEPETVEARLLCDADNLDALGAVGLARVFACAPVYGNPIYDATLPAEFDDSTAGRTSVNHIQKKMLDLPDRMYTPEGRRLAADRADFVERFLERFEAEVAGER